MRAFLCSFGDFSVAIPMDSVSSIFCSCTGSPQVNTIQYNAENRNTYISLPLLFNLCSETHNGIFLKNPAAQDDDSAGNKIVLLSTRVECETEIPDEAIFPIPKTLSNTRFSSLFNGIQFTSSPVFLLNSEQFYSFKMEAAI